MCGGNHVNCFTGTLKIISKQPEALCCRGRVRGMESDFLVSDVAVYMSVSLSEDKYRFLFYLHIHRP